MNKKNQLDLEINKKTIIDNKKKLIENYGPYKDIDLISTLMPYLRLFELFNIKPIRILELGSGFGYSTRYLSLIAEEVIGLDYFNEAIEHARSLSKNIKNINFLCKDIFKDEIGIEQFDLVFCSNFHPLYRDYYKDNDDQKKNYDLIIDKIYNSITKDGYLVISHIESKKQNIDIEKHTLNKFSKLVYEVDERALYVFDFLFRAIKSKRLIISSIIVISIFRKIFFKLKFIKNYKPIWLLKKI